MIEQDFKYIEKQIPKNMRKVLPADPTIADLMPFSTIRLRKKRMRKKFLNMAPWRLPIPKHVRNEYLGHLMVAPIRRTLFHVEKMSIGVEKTWTEE